MPKVGKRRQKIMNKLIWMINMCTSFRIFKQKWRQRQNDVSTFDLHIYFARTFKTGEHWALSKRRTVMGKSSLNDDMKRLCVLPSSRLLLSCWVVSTYARERARVHIVRNCFEGGPNDKSRRILPIFPLSFYINFGRERERASELERRKLECDATNDDSDTLFVFLTF